MHLMLIDEAQRVGFTEATRDVRAAVMLAMLDRVASDMAILGGRAWGRRGNRDEGVWGVEEGEA